MVGQGFSGSIIEISILVFYTGLIFCLFFTIKSKATECVLQQNIAKDREIASLKAELSKLSQKSPVQPKAKRGLLANIKEVVTSPRKGKSGQTLRKTARTAHH